MADPRRTLRLWRRAVLRRRRLVVALLCAAAVVAFAERVAPTPPSQTSVVVASRDLGSGAVIRPDDVHVVSIPDAVVPHGVTGDVSDVVGETIAGPMRAGEAMTDHRVVAPSLVAGYPAGSLAAPVRVHDPDVVALLEVGDRIDVYAAGPDATGSARLLVADSPVVALPATDESRSVGGLVVLAVDSPAAARLAQAADTSTLSVVLRG